MVKKDITLATLLAVYWESFIVNLADPIIFEFPIAQTTPVIDAQNIELIAPYRKDKHKLNV